MFSGSFNKKGGIKGDDGQFDEKKLASLSAEINFFMGGRSEYSAQDAYRYFHLRYGAYPIDISQFLRYKNTSRSTFSDWKVLRPEVDLPLSQTETGECERVMTIVIDTDRAGFPSLKSNKINTYYSGGSDNIIIIIGSYDGVNINSMKVINYPGVEEIEYALEFFRRHSDDGRGILKYLAELFRDKLFSFYPRAGAITVAIESDDVCIMHINGAEGQELSVKFALSPYPAIYFYGYDRQNEYELSEIGLDGLIGACCDAISHGNLIIAEQYGREVGRTTWYGDNLLSEEDLFNFYSQYAANNGIYTPSDVVIKYFSFDGTLTFFVAF